MSHDSLLSNTSATADLLESSRRPWQLLIVGEGLDQLDAQTVADLTRILDLFPAVPYLTVKTINGDCMVSRDFPSNYTAEVDQRLARIFRDNPTVIAIEFPETATRPGHTATPNDAHWSADGATLDALSAAHARGEITVEEMVAAMKQLASAKRA